MTFLARQRAIAARYTRLLGTVEAAAPMTVPPHARPSYWLYPIRLAARARRPRGTR